MPTKEITSGSLKQLWRVTMPLMISSLSMFTMLFVDRLFLSRYSTEALNAAAEAGTLCWAVLYAIMTLAMMAEIFVAQYNGAKEHKRLGEPVWQMIWFSLFTLLFFIPAGIWGASAIYGGGNVHDMVYARWFMFASFPFVLQSALSAFFIGQGKTSIVRWLAILGNVVNIILDPILIFGIKGWVPSMGIPGALIATGIGSAIQCVIFAILFLKKENRDTFGTGNYRFAPKRMWACLKVGFPPAITNFWELLGWAAFYWMMAKISPEHILTASVVQSILMFFLFFGFGLEKGTATVSGNLIGAKKHDKIKELMRSAVKLIGIYTLIVLIFFVIYPDFMLDTFLDNTNLLDNPGAGVMALATKAKVKSLARWGMIMTAIYITVENFRWVLSGILISAGDTMFIMVSGVAAVWLFLILPTYFFVMVPQSSVKSAFFIWVLYSVMAMGILLFRFLQGKWKEKNLLDETGDASEETAEVTLDNKLKDH